MIQPSSTPRRLLERRLDRTLQRVCDGRYYPALRPCVPRLISALRRASDRPVQESPEPFHRIVRESCEPIGEGQLMLDDETALSQVTDRVLQRLDRLRRIALRRGLWAAEPNTNPPQCFG